MRLPQTMSLAGLFLAALGSSVPTLAQFDTSQVSGPGAPPFLMSKTQSTHEDLSGAVPEVSYNVYRRRPAEGFRCISSNRTDPSGWTGPVTLAPLPFPAASTRDATSTPSER